MLQHTATHCNTLQHTSTHYNTLQHTAAHCNALQRTATQFPTARKTDTPQIYSKSDFFGFEYRSGNGGGKFDDDDFDKVCATRDVFM